MSHESPYKKMTFVSGLIEHMYPLYPKPQLTYLQLIAISTLQPSYTMPTYVFLNATISWKSRHGDDSD